MGKRDFINIGIILTIGLLMILIVNPVGNFPLGDDYQYARPVWNLLHNGHYLTTNIFSPIIIAQVFWGGLFCLPFGFSFTTLRISVIILGFAGLLVFYFLMNRFTSDRKLSLICVLLLLVNPIFFSLSNTFMTDIPFLSFSLFSIYYFSKAIDSPQKKYLLAAILFSILATLVRQMGVVLPVAYAITTLFKNKTRSLLLSIKYLLPALIVLVALELALIWLKNSGSPGLRFAGGSFTSLLSKPHEIGLKIVERSSYLFYYCGISLLPILFFSVYNSMKDFTREQKIRVGIFVAIFTPFLLYGLGKFPMEAAGNILDGGSVGPKTLKDGYILHINNPGQLNSFMRFFLSALGLIGAILLLLNIAGFSMYLYKPKEKTGSLKTPFQQIYLFAFSAGYFFLICLPDAYFDRYFLPFIPITLLLSISFVQKNWQIKRYMLSFSFLYIFLLASFSSLATHDYLEWNRTRWEVADYVKKTYNVPAFRIDGGMEYDGWIFGSNFQKDRNKEESFWYAAYNEWIISFGELPECSTIKKFPYTNYLPHETRNLYLVRYNLQGTDADSTDEERIDARISHSEMNVRENPTTKGYYNLGETYFKYGKYTDCIDENRKILAINPNYVPSYHSIAMAYVKLCMWKEAAVEELRALCIDSTFTKARINYKYSVYMMHADNEDITADTYNLQALEYYHEGEYREAITACEKCLQKDPAYYVAWNNMGTSFIAEGNYFEAKRAFEESLKLKPDFEAAKANLAIAIQNINNKRTPQ